ncbi:hypothetical protein PISL3812_07902 [Talaromyces islandicus]|uniref:F-box domain-containing protein n=1 Tax=Talaromyces islandicus TaxID=28573 RepID=A0A0U1M7G8_TALIS|nr:hypothetical protein PISL3812_07902 [Talaromyces islandicus]
MHQSSYPSPFTIHLPPSPLTSTTKHTAQHSIKHEQTGHEAMTFILRISARSITANTYTPTFEEYTLDRVPDLYPLTTPPFNASSGLGDLSKLPNEIIDCILEHMDLASLMNFRSINNQTSAAVNQLSVFKLLCKHAPQTVRGIMSIRTGQWTTCVELWERVCSAYCNNCADFAGYLYVLGPVQRVCFFCFTTSSLYCPLTPCEAKDYFGLLPAECQTDDIPKMRSIPGLYAEEQRASDSSHSTVDGATMPIPCRETLTLLDQAALCKVALDHRAEIEERQKQAQMLWRTHSRNCRRIIISEDHQIHNVKRWMAIIKVPHFVKHERRMDEGFCCRGCNNMAGRESYWRRKFNAQTWREHLMEYGALRNGKHVHSDAELALDLGNLTIG